jgi:transcriptional regulator with GAF, ATPase, and Fis domain
MSSATSRTAAITENTAPAGGRIRLIVRDSDAVQIHLIREGTEIGFGTHPSNALVLDDCTVSRFHCVLARTDVGLVLRDLESRNGTFFNGVHIREAVIADRGRIRVGRSEVDLQPESDIDREVDGAGFGEAIGESLAMRRLFRLLRCVAPSDATVLLQGETGTGKSLIARLIHDASARADQRMVVVDCATLPPTLMEAELFGHERGAFTNADVARTGAFEAADGGSLFLDEIGELPIDLQAKFLRAIEDQRIKRLGSHRETQVDVRLIAATNKDLRAEVDAGRFRSDLFFRLDVVRLTVPPLRERRDDIPRLVRHIVRNVHPHDQTFDISDEELEAMQHAPWPGNIRELKTSIERALVLQDRSLLFGEPARANERADGLFVRDWSQGESFRDAKHRVVQAFEERFLERLLAEAAGNVSRAARIAGMDRNYLRTLIARNASRGSC